MPPKKTPSPASTAGPPAKKAKVAASAEAPARVATRSRAARGPAGGTTTLPAPTAGDGGAVPTNHVASLDSLPQAVRVGLAAELAQALAPQIEIKDTSGRSRQVCGIWNLADGGCNDVACPNNFMHRCCICRTNDATHRAVDCRHGGPLGSVDAAMRD